MGCRVRLDEHRVAVQSLLGAVLEVQRLDCDRSLVEDEFDILITMNMQAEIETVGQLVDTIRKLRAS